MLFEGPIQPSTILTTIRVGGRWWLGELGAIWSDVAPGHWGAPRLIIDAGRDSARVLDRKNRIAAELGAWSGELTAEAVIDRLGKVRPGSRVTLRLPYADCFVRRLDLPAAARAGFKQLLGFQLERLTSFKPSDVYEAHWIAGPAERKGSLAVRHAVVRRKRVDELLELCTRARLRVTAIDCWDEIGEASMPVDFLAARRPERFKQIPHILAIITVLVASAAVLIDSINYEAAITRLTTETAALCRATILAPDASRVCVTHNACQKCRASCLCQEPSTFSDGGS